MLNVIKLVLVVVAVAILECVGVDVYAKVICDVMLPLLAVPVQTADDVNVAVNTALPVPLTVIVGALVYP